MGRRAEQFYQKSREYRTASNILTVIALLLIVCIVYHYTSKDIDLKIAYAGFGPHDYVAHKLHPDNFRNDGPNNIMVYDTSLPMRTYYYLAKYLDIEPAVTTYPYMFIQTLLYVCSVFFLVQTLFGDKYLSFLSVAIGLVFPWAGIDLSRFATRGFGGYLNYALPYGYAISFGLLAVAMFLRERLVLCAILLAISIYSHITMGFFLAAFMASYYLLKPNMLLKKNTVVGVAVLMVLVLPYVALIASNNAINSGGISPDQWVKSTRMFSYHWYPSVMKMFTKNAHRELYPFLIMTFSFFLALRYDDAKDDRQKKIATGVVACLGMTVFGLIIAEVYPVPVLVKMSFQRSSGLVTFFGFLYTVKWAASMIRGWRFFSTAAAVFLLFLLAFRLTISSYLITFLALVVVNHFERVVSKHGRRTSKRSWTGIASPDFHYLQTMTAVFIAGLSIYAVYDSQRNSYYKWHNRYAEIASSYLEVQLWAKANTSPQALFMPEPTHYYGWRDFSERSSFGSFRDWGFTVITYDVSAAMYHEGLKRIGEFGIDIEIISNAEIEKHESFPFANQFNKQVLTAYYTRDDKWREELAHRYGIDYFIMRKSRVNSPSKLSLAYENEHYLVLKSRS